MINPKHMEGKEIRLIFFPGFIHTYNAPTRFFTKEKTPRPTSGDDDDLFQSHARIKPRPGCSVKRVPKVDSRKTLILCCGCWSEFSDYLIKR